MALLFYAIGHVEITDMTVNSLAGDEIVVDMISYADNVLTAPLLPTELATICSYKMLAYGQHINNQQN